MPKYKVLFARFPFGHRDEPDTTDWLVDTVLKAKADPRISDIYHMRIDDTPITMSRNRVMCMARDKGVDYVVMVDNDMKPDCYFAGNPNNLAIDMRAKPFWETAWDFALQHHGPCLVAAPYCGPPPVENVYVFKMTNLQSNHPNVDARLDQFTREEAATRGGIEQVGALPTGLILIDMRVLNHIKPPWFRYEWDDIYEQKKASTEDVTFTRDLAFAGVPIYCAWDCWAAHWKWKAVGKPVPLSIDQFQQNLVECIERKQSLRSRMIMVGEGEARNIPGLYVNGRLLKDVHIADNGVDAPTGMDAGEVAGEDFISSRD